MNIPIGYSFSTVEAAIKKPGRRDLSLIVSEKEAVVSAMFTTNAVKAAPVIIDRKKAKKGLGKAIIVNSGNANACTGDKGRKDVLLISKKIARYLNTKTDLVYVCSTGVIGTPLPMDRIESKFPELIANLGFSLLDDVAEAIMTTDTFKKIASRKLIIGSREVTIAGICKGAGMICPNMATMLAFIITDADISKKALDKALKIAVNKSFNRISVDGDMSTNDTIIAFANGMANNKKIEIKDSDFNIFCDVLSEICLDLAKMIVRDGEGATKFITINIKGARNEKESRKAALAVANSPLVKTAIYGNDANWGRLVAAIGNSGAMIVMDRVGIEINGIKIVNRGIATGKDIEAQEKMKMTKDIDISIDLGLSRLLYQFYTCDLTEEYIKINAEYRT
ncbi:MAG: bifunctional glutamate N-acetyltransferase/amino-acid acetyltransferase ArgJ [Thermodesulfovibrionales bacterium]|nr:bifunctional glutamate N-acetyltransferase/amino-acid acetyltransferase ArgJ [Thermodesulfovibrionales bacterium]